MRRLINRTHWLAALGLLLACAPRLPGADAPDPAAATETPAQYEARMQWWREARLGMFIHWGPVSLKGTEIGWSREERPGIGGKGEIPVAVYDNLYKEFNPVKFNAREWVAIAKAMGAKYLVLTSKHHDGFCMFDSQLTDYKITKSPFQRDVAKELADACHKAGIKLGYYYSPPDFHHPDYRTMNNARYIEYMHGQLRELCTRYGQVDIIWFDGLNSTAKELESTKLLAMIRQLQPKVIINNRSGLPADHDTPEQEVGHFQNTRAWESCITLCNQWAWKPDDAMKSLQQCVQTLVRCAGGDGNLLFNVGPMPTGEIEPRQVVRLKEMGQWLQGYGESVYGTRGGPFKPGAWGASTYKNNTIYLHVLAWADPQLTLPAISRKVVASSLLTGGEVSVKQGNEGLVISVAPDHRRDIDTIVKLDLDGAASEIPPITTQSSGSLGVGKPATASNVFMKEPAYAPDKAFDDDPGTRWATDGGTKQAWLAVDLGKACTFDQIRIAEACGSRVQGFELQYQAGTEWKTIVRGTTIGENWTHKFEPLTAQQVRLNILEATEGPTLWEFQILQSKK